MARRAAPASRAQPGLLGRLRGRIPGRTGEVAAQVVLRLLLVVVLVVAGYLLVLEMEGYLAGLERFQVSPASINFLAVPSWVTPGIREQIGRAPGLPERFSILEPGLAGRVAQAYRRNPWVAEVTLVERRFPNRLKVGLVLRRPVVAVRYRGSYYLVDAQAVRLPLRFRSWPQPGYRLPIVTGVTEQPPRSGAAWQDGAVRAGGAVAELLRTQGLDRALEITAVDVSNLGGRIRRDRPGIVLHTASRMRIFWGRSPLRWGPGDGSQTVSRKLLYLSKLARNKNLNFRRLDYVDLRFDNLVARERL